MSQEIRSAIKIGPNMSIKFGPPASYKVPPHHGTDNTVELLATGITTLLDLGKD